MPGFLRQATASQSVGIGPFLDDTDFKTAETGLTIANTDIKLVVNGGASANKNSGGGTHRVNGMYGITFDATDTATVGVIDVSVVVAGALPVFDRFQVIEEAVYDALFAASALGYVANQPVDVNTIKTQTVTCAAGVTVLASVGTAATSTAQTGDAFARLGAPAGASVSADVAAVKVDTAAILDDTGTSGVVVAAASKTGYTLTATTGLGNQTADITGSLSGSVGSVTGAVGSVTGNVGGNVAGSVGSLTTNNDKTGYALSATGSAAMTESYAALGAAGTLPQILYEIRALLAEKSISTTTLTTKKLDGSTTAATYTLDNATTPSAITRAT